MANTTNNYKAPLGVSNRTQTTLNFFSDDIYIKGGRWDNTKWTFPTEVALKLLFIMESMDKPTATTYTMVAPTTSLTQAALTNMGLDTDDLTDIPTCISALASTYTSGGTGMYHKGRGFTGRGNAKYVMQDLYQDGIDITNVHTTGTAGNPEALTYLAQNRKHNVHSFRPVDKISIKRWADQYGSAMYGLENLIPWIDFSEINPVSLNENWLDRDVHMVFYPVEFNDTSNVGTYLKNIAELWDSLTISTTESNGSYTFTSNLTFKDTYERAHGTVTATSKTKADICSVVQLYYSIIKMMMLNQSGTDCRLTPMAYTANTQVGRTDDGQGQTPTVNVTSIMTSQYRCMSMQDLIDTIMHSIEEGI